MDSTALDKFRFKDDVEKEFFVHVMRKLAVRIHLFTENGLGKCLERFFDEDLQSACFDVLPKGMASSVLIFITADRDIMITVDNHFALVQFQKTPFGMGVIRAITHHLALDLAIINSDDSEDNVCIPGKQ